MVNDGVYKYSYDAWNRLVSVQRRGPTAAPQTIATYRYDGLGHRIYKKVEHSGDMDREEYYYYNARWQLLEIATASNQARQQLVWGTNYIDEAISMDVDTNDDGICTGTGSRHFFYMQDANWNVVGLREGTSVVERYEYDPYGTVRIYRGSATAGAAEQRTVAGQSLKWLDGTLPANPVLYAGYFQDSETSLYHVRNRMLGRDRWLQRDPVGYGEGMDLYQYVHASPAGHIDPLGTEDWSGADIPRDGPIEAVFRGLRAERDLHRSHLYYGPAHVGELFDTLRETMRHILYRWYWTESKDDPLGAYQPLDNTLAIGEDRSGLTMVHELVHATDARNGWYLHILRPGISPFADRRAAEALAHGTEWQLLEAKMSLAAMERVGSCAAAQIQWKMTWQAFEGMIGRSYQYGVFGATAPLTSADLTDVAAKLSLKFSCSQLKPIYEQMLYDRGIAAETYRFARYPMKCPCFLTCSSALSPCFR